jgi:predicted GH43/DUF377 family glycosyl hydrolase
MEAFLKYNRNLKKYKGGIKMETGMWGMGRWRDEAEFIGLEPVKGNPLFSKEKIARNIKSSAGTHRAFNLNVIGLGEGDPFSKELREVLEEDCPGWNKIEDGASNNEPFLDRPVLGGLRVTRRDKKSGIHMVASMNGVTGWKIYEECVLGPVEGDATDFGSEDMRMFIIPGIGLVATVVRYHNDVNFGPIFRTEILKLVDFHSFEFEYMGTVGLPGVKDVILCEDKVGDEYGAHCRPEIGENYHIVYASSPDFRHWDWGRGIRIVLKASREPWTLNKVGWNSRFLWVPPRKELPKGAYLGSLHGVDLENEYAIGFALRDSQRPWVVTHVSPVWFFDPEAGYRHSIPGKLRAIFSCGWEWNRKTDMIFVYVTMADSEVWLYTLSGTRIVDYLLMHPV